MKNTILSLIWFFIKSSFSSKKIFWEKKNNQKKKLSVVNFSCSDGHIGNILMLYYPV
jgi:hypothetical protein